ncbi:MAG: hypothetical protein ACRDPK_04380 [Carbonactinosporaceae bacterium]
MTQDQAALLAQVIPVIALATGLELREMARRLVDHLGRTDDEDTDWPPVWPAFLLCLTLPVLAIAELYALELAMGQPWHPFLGEYGRGAPSDDLLFGVLRITVLTAFVTPAWDAAQRLVLARWPRLARRPTRLLVSNLVLGGLAAVATWTSFVIDG